ncbi:MAG: efflux RND transporter periplasmic adaptor subunit [Planctomycetes bacterium]|nr:efflux RND transporter periplasmic adaptor subunit [Planctomycetota bacterium]
MSYPSGKHPKRTVRWGLSLAGLVLFSSVATVHWVHAHEGHGEEEAGEFDLDAPRIVSSQTAKHIGLQVAEIDTQPLEEILELTGWVEPLPDQHRDVVGRVAGEVTEVTKQVGDEVKAGEVLVRIDSPEFARNLYEVRKIEVDYQKLQLEIERSGAKAEQAGAEVEIAKIEIAYAQAELDRFRSIEGEGVAQKEVARWETEVARDRGKLRLDEIALTTAVRETEALQGQAKALRLSRQALMVLNNIDPGADVDQQLTSTYEIRAENNGVVVSRSVRPGQWAEPGQVLLEVADYSRVRVVGELPESLIHRVRDRQSDKVRLRVAADREFLGEGAIRYIAPQLDPVKRTAHLFIDAPNPGGTLRGNMWVDLTIVLREVKQALVVPRSAVVIMGPMHFVFVKNGEEYVKQDIVPGVTDDQFVEVLDGLVPRDPVVVQGAYSLTHLKPKKAKK